ncbi:MULTISPECIES: rod shape-determining protein MreC [unclassified Sulfurospirillum]|uniref:rod shape-determining protein MreC n=1 Tax=unclassified Sulfurospirillum TaxID=2618290 RepID=UPI0005062ED9|nr:MULTISPECIES: rod shape-determining protein MreC [unclassified Sulfurospirillum]KFL34170.1 rod shape-determining protein MreC [Sulfurospirillum sp. SCADC]
MSKLKIIILLGIFVFVSFRYSTEARHIVGSANTKILASYVEIKTKIQEKIDEHFSQQEEIQRLRTENQTLQKSAVLSIAFASKLNDMLKEHNTTGYDPQVKMVQSIGYTNLNDYGKVWLKFDEFNQSKIYGLLQQGYAAGIVVSNDGHPQGLLLSDPKAIFAVYVGNQKMQGVAQGNSKELLVKYISQWLQPHVGDEVITSGLDTLFFEGIKVGVVTEVIEEESSKTVVVKPYATSHVPSYMHVIVRN